MHRRMDIFELCISLKFRPLGCTCPQTCDLAIDGRCPCMDPASRMPSLTACLLLKLSCDPHFDSLPFCMAPAWLAVGEWDLLLHSDAASPIRRCSGELTMWHVGQAILQQRVMALFHQSPEDRQLPLHSVPMMAIAPIAARRKRQ